jgi:pimeloyl-ACP methyl ester carboxylesterase
MSKPSILFFPGSFVLVSVYQPIFDAVSKAGYEIKGIHPPSIGPSSRQGRDGPAPSMYDDAAVVAKEVEKLADQGRDVILIAHSYGGGPISQSTKGLSKEERKAQGKSGGIVRLAYMTAVVPAVGQSAQNVLSGTRNDGDMPVSMDVSFSRPPNQAS